MQRVCSAVMEQGALKAVDAVIDALGGTTAVGLLTGQSAQAVSNWRSRKRIPPEHFLTVCGALEATGKTVTPEVFGMKPSPQAESAA